MNTANDLYHARDRLSNSRLSVLKRSPREYRQRFIDKTWVDEPNDNFLVGELVHCLMLERDKYGERYAVAPKVDRRTKQGKLDWEIFCEMSSGKKPITMEMSYESVRCCTRLFQHDLFADIDWNPQRETVHVEHEIDFEFNDAECKAKLDYVDTERKLIVDLKTTNDASPSGFAKSVEQYGYHRQAAFYLAAAEMHFDQRFRFLFACVEKSPPHHVAVHELDADALRTGYQELETLIDEWKVRTERDNWEPDWSSGIVSLSLSRWYKSNIYEVG